MTNEPMFPFLRLAKTHGVDYAIVLKVADELRQGRYPDPVLTGQARAQAGLISDFPEDITMAVHAVARSRTKEWNNIKWQAPASPF